MPNNPMWFAGDEDGDILLFCEREECKDEEGYWYWKSISRYHPNPGDLQKAWDEHLVKHKEK